jgi:hypothetical protein
MGVPDTRQLRQEEEPELVGQEEGEDCLNWTEVFPAVPDWLVRLQVESVWAPVLDMNLKTRDSSVCISFGQSCSVCISFGQSCNIRRELESRDFRREARSVEEMSSSARLMAN